MFNLVMTISCGQHECLLSTSCLTDSVCHFENDCFSHSCGSDQTPYCNNGGCNCKGLFFFL